MTEPWLGHRDLCSIQWSDWCNCDPNNPVYLPREPKADTEDNN